MNNSFAILAGFLDRGETEVEGRTLEAPPETFRAKLRDFARGELPEPERLEVITRLNRNPQWILLLAEDVKALREQAAAAAAEEGM